MAEKRNRWGTSSPDNSEESSSSNGAAPTYLKPSQFGKDRSQAFPTTYPPQPVNIFAAMQSGTTNPFAAKFHQNTPGYADSSCDSLSGEDESKPLIAPPTFQANKLSAAASSRSDKSLSPEPDKLSENQNMNSDVTSTPLTASGRSLFRPSALSAHTAHITQKKGPGNKENRDKLVEKLMASCEKSVGKLADKTSTSNGVSVTTENYFLPSRDSGKGDDKNGFVFGQNMDERVVNAPPTESEESAEEQETEQKQEGSNQTVVHTDSSNIEKNDAVTEVKSPRTLADSAREYEARHTKPQYEEVEVITGEENESNVLQLHAKLYLFDVDKKSWTERGAGLVRLNDMRCSEEQEFQSRLIMRSQGSLRVILNTKIWSAMTVDRANEKSIRITAIDDDRPKVFIITVAPKDADQLYSAIESRIQSLKLKEVTRKELKREREPEERTSVRSPEATPCMKRARTSLDSPARTDSLTPTTDVLEESNSSLPDTETEVSNDSLGSGRLAPPSTSTTSADTTPSDFTPEKVASDSVADGASLKPRSESSDVAEPSE